MSHFTRIRTQLRNIKTVQQALEDLGYTVEDGDVRGYADQHTDADLVVRTDSGYDIGFRKERGVVVMVGDFWGLRLDRQAFLNQVSQRYAYLTVRDQAEAQGWQMVTEEAQPDGSIRLVMQQWS
jgi:hypothetical protein